VTSGKFLQSKEWAEFQERLGRKTFRVNGALVIKMPLMFGFFYFYSPKDGIFNLDEIKKLAQKEKTVFLRIEPPEAPPKGFIKIKDIQPKCTLITDISKPEDKLLAEMHEKTRYNIRLAERKGLRIENKGFDNFYDLLQKTSARQKIKLHSRDYYKKLAEFNEIFIAYHENKPAACAMVNFYEDTATYLHGGSDEKYKNLMAPHLLHWEIIKTAKSRGIKFYDWWGIDEKKWPGITRFKRGFGGKELCSPGTFDFPINKFIYRIYHYARK